MRLRRWKLTCIPQEPSPLRPFHAAKRPSSFSSAAAAAYDFSSGASRTEQSGLEEDPPAFGFAHGMDQGRAPPSISLSHYHLHVSKAQGEAFLGGQDGCMGVLGEGESAGSPPPPLVKSSTLSLLAECHALARCGSVSELKGALRLLVAKEGSGSAFPICELLSYFRGWERHGLLWDVLVDVYASYEMPDDALFVLSKMNHQGMQASRFTYNSLMYSLRNTDAVWDLYAVIRAQALPCTDYMHNILLSHLCKQGRLRDAVSFFQDKRGIGELTPCIVTFNILIAGCCKLGSIPIAKSFLSMLTKCGLFPNKYTYSPLIHALCLEGSMEEALALSEDMEKKGVEIDMFTYNVLIQGFCINQMMYVVWKVFKMMFTKGLRPDYDTYRILMIGHLKHGNIKEGLWLKQEILARGFQLNIFTYSILLNALYKKGLLSEVEQLLHEIHYFGLDLDHVAYSILINCYCKLGEVGRALQLFKLMCIKGIMPNSFNHLSVLLAFCKNGMLLEARHYLESLVASGQLVDVILYNVVMDGFVKARDLYGALSLYGEMIKYGISPTIVTFNSLIDGFCQGGKVTDAKALYRTMELQGLLPNTITYTTIMDAYCKVGDVDSMIELFDQMVGKAVMPNVVTYSVIMKGLCRGGRPEKALLILRDMQSKGICADQITFNTLIEGFCKANDIGMALHLHDEMLQYFQPTPVTYNLLINALCTNHCLQIAETLVERLLENGVRLERFAYTPVIKAQCVMGNPCKAVLFFDKMIQAVQDHHKWFSIKLNCWHFIRCCIELGSSTPEKWMLVSDTSFFSSIVSCFGKDASYIATTRPWFFRASAVWGENQRRGEERKGRRYYQVLEGASLGLSTWDISTN